MYKSPIEIIQGKIWMEQEANILRAVYEQDILVDKHELLRALQYDRGQYEKGYQDGQRDAVVHGFNTYDHDSMFECSVCGFSDCDTYTSDGKYNYCPGCGAKMDGGKENG